MPSSQLITESGNCQQFAQVVALMKAKSLKSELEGPFLILYPPQHHSDTTCRKPKNKLILWCCSHF